MSVLIREDHGDWHEPAGRGYDNEAALQQILVDHPGLVPGVDGEAIACMEFESSVGPADVVVLDAKGSITIVECKLRANAEVRRTVVGQLLDYAARFWQMDVAQFEQRWMRVAGRNPFEQLEDSDGTLRDTVAANLAAAKFNLVLAVDALHDDLRRIVEYLNEIAKPTTGVMLVEFRRLHEGGLEILIPRSYGAELVEAKVDSAQGKQPRWTSTDFIDWCEKHAAEELDTARTLLKAMDDKGFEVIGGQAKTPSLNATLMSEILGRVGAISLYTDSNRGPLLEVRYNLFDSDEENAAFSASVCAVRGVTISANALRQAGYRRRPSMPLSGFTQESAQQLVEVIASALTVQVPLVGGHPVAVQSEG